MYNILNNYTGSFSTTPPIPANDDTTSDGKQVFWILGDSISRGTSSAKGPTPSPGTVFEWNNTAVVEVGANDLLNANIGSEWPQFGIDYNAASTFKPVFVSTGSTGSEFSPNGDTNNWSTSGSLYTPAKARVTACLANLNLTKPKAILMVLGINDANPSAVSSLPSVLSDMISLFDRLTTDYPGVPIVIAQIGIVSTVSGARVLAIRDYLKTMVRTYADVNIGAYLAPLFGTGDYNADQIHLNQSGNNKLGSMFARWFANPGYDKWSRAIISCHFDDLSTARKNVISTVISMLGDNYFELDAFYNFKTTLEDNTLIDWTFSTFGLKSGFTITPNDCITTDGAATFFRTNVNTALSIKGTMNDKFEIVRIKTNRSGLGALRIATGLGNASSQASIGQASTGGLYYRAFDMTLNTSAIDSTLQNNTVYGWYRPSSTVKGLLKNGTSIATGTVNSISAPSIMSFVGANNNNNVANAFLDADFHAFAAGKYSTVDQTILYAAIEYLVANW